MIDSVGHNEWIEKMYACVISVCGLFSIMVTLEWQNKSDKLLTPFP